MALQKLSNAEIRVNDLDAAIDFHVTTLGLNEIGRQDGVVFMGAGGDGLVDLALRVGGTGAVGFSLAADDEGDLERFSDILWNAGVKTAKSSDTMPGVLKSLDFHLPSGHAAHIVTLAERNMYVHPARGPQPRSGAISPLDLDHITLRVGDKVRETMDFLRETLGFRSSDIVQLPNGEPMATWMHIGDYHHDVAMFGGKPGDTLDHIAWQMDGIDHIKRSLDALARVGIKTETGPGRHGVGGNLYAYFWSPGGNRYELSAEMPRAVDRHAKPVIWNDPSAGFSAWGARHPDSFADGS